MTKIDLLGTEIKNGRTVLFDGCADRIKIERYGAADSSEKKAKGKRIARTLLTVTQEGTL